MPHRDLFPDGFLRHAPEPARFRRPAQGGWECLVLSTIVLALLHAGCARLPRASSGTAARDRFLSVYAAAHGAARGAGSLSLKRGDEGRGGAQARWGANAESLAVVAYVGPARVMDASLKADSLFLVFRRLGTGVAGTLRGDDLIDGRVLRFAATPWDFSASWVRRALERAEIQASADGWRLAGTLGAEGGSGPTFVLELSRRGEPVSLALSGDDGRGERIRVRYGPERRFTAGRIPGWIEWSFSGSVVRLQVEDHAPADPAKVRYAPPAESGWTILSLDSPGGRSLVRWLLGLSEGGGAKP